MNKGAPLPATYRRLHTELPDQKQLSSRLSSAATRLVRAQGFSFPPFPFPLYYLSLSLSRRKGSLTPRRQGCVSIFLGEDPGGRNDSEYDSDGWTIETEEGGAGGGGIEWRVAEEGPTRCKPRVPQIASPRSVVAALDASTLRPANYLFTPAQ